MSKLITAGKLAIADIAKLQTPALATAIAGGLAPIVAALLGVDVTAAELAGDLIAAGGVAALLQKLPAVKNAK